LQYAPALHRCTSWLILRSKALWKSHFSCFPSVLFRQIKRCDTAENLLRPDPWERRDAGD
jgi:hypothetical protein